MNNYRPSQAAPMRHHPQLGQPGMTIIRNPARPPNGGANGSGYGNAAKGIRPPPAQVVDERDHRNKLQSLLTGQQRLLAAQSAVKGPAGDGNGHLPGLNGHVAKSPTKGNVVLPAVGNGHMQSGASKGGAVARGRGGARGRGTRGRGGITGVPME
jgi:hypothetical protein